MAIRLVAKFDDRAGMERAVAPLRRLDMNIDSKFTAERYGTESSIGSQTYKLQVQISKPLANQASTIIRSNGGRLLQQPVPPDPYLPSGP